MESLHFRYSGGWGVTHLFIFRPAAYPGRFLQGLVREKIDEAIINGPDYRRRSKALKGPLRPEPWKQAPSVLQGRIGPGARVEQWRSPAIIHVLAASASVSSDAAPPIIDIGSNTVNMDVIKIEAAVTPCTRASSSARSLRLGACVTDATMAITQRHAAIESEPRAIGRDLPT